MGPMTQLISRIIMPVAGNGHADADRGGTIPASSTNGLYQNVMRQFHRAADAIQLDPDVRRILAMSKNEIVVHFPVKMNNGRVEMFTGYRVQHNDALGQH